MRRAWWLMLLLPLWVQAEPVTVELRDASIGTFLQTVMRGVLNRDYVVSSDVPPEKRVTAFIRGMEPSKAEAFALELLRSQGLDVVERAGVLFVSMSTSAGVGSAASSPSALPVTSAGPAVLPEPEPLDWVVYRPRHRSVAFLSSVVQVAGGRVAGGQSQLPLQGQQWQGSGGVSQQVGQFGQPDNRTMHAASAPAVQVAGASASDVLIYGVAESKAGKISALLEQVDTALPVVSIRAVLLEVSDSSDSSRSIQGALQLLSGKIGIAYQAGAALAGGAINIKGHDLQAVLSLVDGDSRFRYVTEPTLQVVSGETATLTVGSDVPVRGQMQVTQSGAAIQGVEYRTGGLLLAVTPQVFADSTLVKVDQQVSSFATTTTSTIDSPTLLKRKLTSTVRAVDSEVVMLAGLDETRDSDSHSGLSFLPSWARSKSETKARSQLVLLLEVKRQKRVGG